MLFTRPQWRSWLVKGAFIIAGYTLVLASHFLASVLGSRSVQSWLLIAGAPLSTLTAVYTAYLFAQAKARDLWQNPLLPPHLLVQAFLLGSSVMLLFAAWLRGTFASDRLPGSISQDILIWLWVVPVSSLLHVLMIWGEVSLTHATAHAR